MLFHYMFFIGSIGGFFLELFYRKLILKKWIKPGVFKGFYLPLYGFGLVIIYFCYLLKMPLIFKLILSMVFLTVIEFICGCIFIKKLKIPLWNYSNQFLNYKGLICFKYSVFWALLSLICFIFFEFMRIYTFVIMDMIVMVFEGFLLLDFFVFLKDK